LSEQLRLIHTKSAPGKFPLRAAGDGERSKQ
jgi:hypothetical protein